VKEIFLDSDTKIALISSAPSDEPRDWFLTNEQMAAARARVNDEAGGKLEELSFDNDLWNGKRTQWISGAKILEENWVAGKRQGIQKEWLKGKEIATEFKDDSPVKK